MNIKWRNEDRQYIKDNAGAMRDQDIARELSLRNGRDVSLGAVRKLRQRMGIVKKCGRGIYELDEK